MKCKSLFLLFVFILSTVYFQAQNNAVISVDKLNILYEGIDNPISIAVAGVSADKIQIAAEGVTITKIDDIHYTVNPSNKKTVCISIFSTSEKDTVYYGSVNFRVKQIPSQNLYLGQIEVIDNLSIKKEILKSNNNLFFRPDSQFEYEVKMPVVVSFSISFINNGNIENLKIEGNKITSDIINKLMSLPEGSTITVSEINVNRDNKINMVEGFKFTID